MGRFALAAAVLVLVLAAPAAAAIYVCHPDPAGTRVLHLRGDVLGYRVQGATATIAVRSGDACATVTWSGTATSRRAACTNLQQPYAAPHGVRVVRPPAGVDRPDRLAVASTGRSWPLPVRVRPNTLQVAGDLAGYEALGGHGFWVTRLGDGKTTFVAPVKSGRPVLDADGAFYVDNVYKSAAPNRPVVKFVPTAALQSELVRVGAPVHTGGAIRAFSMDGNTIALVVAGRCDRVVFWNVPWRSVMQVSQQAGVTCAGLGASRHISQIALGGARAQWVTMQQGKPVVVAADDIGCQEWVVGRLPSGSHVLIAGDGTTLAFTTAGRISHVLGSYRTAGLYEASGVQALAADGTLTAVLAHGLVTIHAAQTRELTLPAAGAQSVALRGSTVVTTTASGRLDVYRAARLVHSWPLPSGARPRVDLRYGIAVVTTRNGVYAIDTTNGRSALVASTPATPRAQISPLGVGYVYSLAGRGTAALVPMAAVEAAVGR
ncbi:MAG TPA: hypothetical protein VFA30_04460 [Gaiellaceae bacterium]|nr:hypothetical protein [Gaiellaceae bacterium]